MSLGYVAMLIAMTYQVELFFCIVIGLATGFALFNLSEPPPENVDPCCTDGGHNDVLYKTLTDTEDGPEDVNGAILEYDHPSEYSITIFVKGMTCDNCSATVQNALKVLPNVKQAHAHHASGRCTIYYGKWCALMALVHADGLPMNSACVPVSIAASCASLGFRS